MTDDVPAEAITPAMVDAAYDNITEPMWASAGDIPNEATVHDRCGLLAAALEAAAPALRDQAATTERRRIIQLAERVNATCPHYPAGSHVSKQTRPFADLLRDQPQPTTTQEPT